MKYLLFLFDTLAVKLDLRTCPWPDDFTVDNEPALGMGLNV